MSCCEESPVKLALLNSLVGKEVAIALDNAPTPLGGKLETHPTLDGLFMIVQQDKDRGQRLVTVNVYFSADDYSWVTERIETGSIAIM